MAITNLPFVKQLGVAFERTPSFIPHSNTSGLLALPFLCIPDVSTIYSLVFLLTATILFHAIIDSLLKSSNDVIIGLLVTLFTSPAASVKQTVLK